MNWLRLQSFLNFFVSPFLVLLYFWLGTNVLYYGLEIIVPVLETAAKVCRSSQGLLEPVSSLLWHLVRWMGYVVGFMVFVALRILGNSMS